MKYLKVTVIAVIGLFWIGSFLAVTAGYGYQMFILANGVAVAASVAAGLFYLCKALLEGD